MFLLFFFVTFVITSLVGYNFNKILPFCHIRGAIEHKLDTDHMAFNYKRKESHDIIKERKRKTSLIDGYTNEKKNKRRKSIRKRHQFEQVKLNHCVSLLLYCCLSLMMEYIYKKYPSSIHQAQRSCGEIFLFFIFISFSSSSDNNNCTGKKGRHLKEHIVTQYFRVIVGLFESCRVTVLYRRRHP